MIRLIAAVILLIAVPALADEQGHPFVQGSWQQLLHKHQGRPTIVHFWGVTCAPCMVEMPKWAKLADADRSFDLVLVDADPVGENAAGAMLTKMGLSKAENWGFADDFTDRLRYEIDPKWHGELPLTLLIGPDGTTTKILGSADFGEVKRWLGKQDGAKH